MSFWLVIQRAHNIAGNSAIRGKETVNVSYPFDSSRYPRTYRESALTRGVWSIAALVFVWGGFWGIGYLAASGIEADLSGLALDFILLAVAVVCCAAATLKRKVVLTADGIEKHSAFRMPCCQLRSQIAGWRKVRDRNSYYFELVPRNRGVKTLTIYPAAGLVLDEAFGAWFYSLPQLDEVERSCRFMQ